MHPVIRVICFLLVSGFVVFGGVYELAFGLLVVCSVVLIKRFQSLELSLRIIKRMKWFFLSILVVYLWFTPGTPVLDMEVSGMPTIEGIRTGLLRVVSLVLIIFAVNYFVSSIARSRLVEAIIWLLAPFKWVGIDNSRVALRVALVMELIPKVQQIVLDIKQAYLEQGVVTSDKKITTVPGRVKAKLSAASRLLEQVFERVVDEAVNMPHEKITLAEASNPPVTQWSIPVVLAGLFVWIRTM